MAVVEGRGRVAPSPVNVALTESDWQLIDRLGRLRAEKYQGRSGYSGGLMGNAVDPNIVGVAGETAFRYWMNAKLKVSAFNIDQGDQFDAGWDFNVCGVKVDVKSGQAPKELKITRVRHGHLRPINADIFVLIRVDLAQRFVKLLGWIKKKEIEKFNRSPLANAEHWNLIADIEDLKPMNRLVQYFSAKLKAGVA